MAPCDASFGAVDCNWRKASVLWASYLVFPWGKDDMVEFTGKRLPDSARPSVQDLMARMDRPIVADIAKGDIDPRSSGEKDDLAAGIAFCPLEWKSDVMQGGANWEALRQKAEFYLLKAFHEGDAVLRSFASLAYAYCPWRFTTDSRGVQEVGPSGALIDIPFPENSRPRLSVYRARLADTYNRFLQLVPERALRAAY